MKTISNFNAYELMNASNVEGGTFGCLTGLLSNFSNICGQNYEQPVAPVPTCNIPVPPTCEVPTPVPAPSYNTSQIQGGGANGYTQSGATNGYTTPTTNTCQTYRPKTYSKCGR
jgi:hypothetical protein